MSKESFIREKWGISLEDLALKSCHSLDFFPSIAVRETVEGSPQITEDTAEG